MAEIPYEFNLRYHHHLEMPNIKTENFRSIYIIAELFVLQILIALFFFKYIVSVKAGSNKKVLMRVDSHAILVSGCIWCYPNITILWRYRLVKTHLFFKFFFSAKFKVPPVAIRERQLSLTSVLLSHSLIMLSHPEIIPRWWFAMSYTFNWILELIKVFILVRTKFSETIMTEQRISLNNFHPIE